jgi:quercetin dioxygenase-like cupin family protein
MAQMIDAATKTKPAAAKPAAKAQKLAYGDVNCPTVPGRRDWFKYRDLGVQAASSGKVRAQTMATSKGMSEPTGWHYHTCEAQFVYALKGWVDLVFEDGSEIRLKQGESLYIPGGMKHNETGTSEELEILELSIPAEMGTVACEAPEGFSK